MPAWEDSRKGKRPFRKNLLPLLSFRVPEQFTNFNPTPVGFPPPKIKKISFYRVIAAPLLLSLQPPLPLYLAANYCFSRVAKWATGFAITPSFRA